MGLMGRIRRSAVWRSVFRGDIPRDRRGRIRVVLSSFFLHLHPVAIRRSGMRLSYTWCMGGVACLLFLIELATGILLMFYYRPTAAHAYQDIQGLRAHVTLGMAREMHRWAGHAMVIAVFLHMLRVFLTGSYKPPRQFNWVVGVMLLVLTLLLSFTGYLLPWDQLALWAVTVGTGMAGAAPLAGAEGPGSSALVFPGTDAQMVHHGSDIRFFLLGGPEIGENALLRFYVLHCVLLPAATVALMAIHFWRVRKDGGVSGPL